MWIIGCDDHPSFQQIGWVDTETGEGSEQQLTHSNGEAETFYRDLQRRGVQARVWIEEIGETVRRSPVSLTQVTGLAARV